jgi:uncharacterized protein (DUF433 family)
VSVEGLEHYSKDQLIEELIHRQTFVGIVVFHRGDAKAGRLDRGEIVMTKSPPLTREGVDDLLHLGQSLVPGMFGEDLAIVAIGPAEAILLHPASHPLRLDDGGCIRVGKSRLSLDLIVELYENGLTPEDMVRVYDTLMLDEAYSVIAYYLRYQNEVRTYLKRRAEEADILRAKIEAERPRIAREELLARDMSGEKNHAPTGR